MRKTDRIFDAFAGEIQKLGYELVDVEIANEQGSRVLTFYIDSPNGITVEDCERVSRFLDPLIDEMDPIEESFFLSVSSPGLDRPLKKPRDFERFLGKPVTVKLYAKIDKLKEFTGDLTGYDADGVTLALKDRSNRQFQFKDVASIKPYIDFH